MSRPPTPSLLPAAAAAGAAAAGAGAAAAGAAAGAAGAAAAAAAAAVRFPAAERPRVAGPLAGAGLGTLKGATLAAAPFLTYLFPIKKLGYQLSKAQA